MWAVIGLGNPGRRYAGTRHNVGCACVRSLAKCWDVRLRKRIFLSRAAELDRRGQKVLLALPQTYMNNSGEAVRRILGGREIEPAHLLVVYDDLDIPLGRIRVRKEGGSGGHKGMASIIRESGTPGFPRVRIGIGPVPEHEDPVDFVLSAFTEEDRPSVESGLLQARAAVELILDGRIDESMNVYNSRKAVEDTNSPEEKSRS